MQDNIWTKCAHFGRCTLEEQDKELKDRIAQLEKEQAEQAEEIKKHRSRQKRHLGI